VIRLIIVPDALLPANLPKDCNALQNQKRELAKNGTNFSIIGKFMSQYLVV